MSDNEAAHAASPLGTCDSSLLTALLEPSDNPVAKTFQKDIYRAGLPVIVFSVPDLQAAYERLTARGVTFRKPPTQSEAGWEAVFDDTCGNLIQILEG